MRGKKKTITERKAVLEAMVNLKSENDPFEKAMFVGKPLYTSFSLPYVVGVFLSPEFIAWDSSSLVMVIKISVTPLEKGKEDQNLVQQRL